jgi:hypothetical protein
MLAQLPAPVLASLPAAVLSLLPVTLLAPCRTACSRDRDPCRDRNCSV